MRLVVGVTQFQVLYFLIKVLYHYLVLFRMFGKQIKQMLIRHISIPRQSIPISTASHKNIQNTYQLRDYSDYLTRTLNPQLPDHDVLVSEKTANRLLANEKVESRKEMFGRSESMLEREAPQSLQNFTNFNLEFQGEIKEDTCIKQRKTRSNLGFYKKQNQNYNTKIVRQLNNDAYLQSKLQKRDYSLTPILSKTNYLSKNEVDNEQYDNGIVNKHTKSSIVHGGLYRTLEKIQAKNVGNRLGDTNVPLSSKKYSYSLPKNNFSPKVVQKVAEFTQTQDFNESKPLTKRVNIKKDLSYLVKTNKINSSKKHVLPVEDQQNGQNIEINMEPMIRKKRAISKTPQQSNIVSKMQSQVSFNNKYLKNNPFIPHQVPKVPKQKIEISYKTSLFQLKQICSLKELEKVNLIMKIPEIFSYPLFTGLQDQSNLFTKSEQLLKHLQINHKNELSIKKYNNCILLIVNYIAVVWHYTGKRYLGGWKYGMLDDGNKHGLGLEWSPNNYVYYGEFVRGKRQGVGIMKNSANELLAGEWRQNKFLGSLLRKGASALFQAEKVAL